MKEGEMYSDSITYLRQLLQVKLAFMSWLGKPIHVGNGEYRTLKGILLNDRDELVFECDSGDKLQLLEFADHNGQQDTLNSILGFK
jgi:hypothetical protein